MIIRKIQDPHELCNPFAKQAHLPYILMTHCYKCHSPLIKDLTTEVVSDIKVGHVDVQFHCVNCGMYQNETIHVSVHVTTNS